MLTKASRMDRPEATLRVVRAAVADAEEVGDLDRSKFVAAVGLVGAMHIVKELAHLRLLAR
jgi:hypothetical protein